MSNGPLTGIAFTGHFGAGKDAAADYIESVAPRVSRLAFAKPLKVELEKMTVRRFRSSSDEEIDRVLELVKDRSAMALGWQWWGVFRREVDPDYWVKRTAELIDPSDFVVITDMRFQNEFEWASKSGLLTVRIVGPNRRSGDPRSQDHISEKQICTFPVQEEILNFGSRDEFLSRVDALLWKYFPDEISYRDAAHSTNR